MAKPLRSREQLREAAEDPGTFLRGGGHRVVTVEVVAAGGVEVVGRLRAANSELEVGIVALGDEDHGLFHALDVAELIEAGGGGGELVVKEQDMV